MPGIQRVGDANNQGGVISGGAASVRIEGRPASLTGDAVSAHFCCGRRGCPPVHCSAKTVGGSETVRAEGKPLVRTGDPDTCGHPRAGGAASVRCA